MLQFWYFYNTIDGIFDDNRKSHERKLQLHATRIVRVCVWVSVSVCVCDNNRALFTLGKSKDVASINDSFASSGMWHVSTDLRALRLVHRKNPKPKAQNTFHTATLPHTCYRLLLCQQFYLRSVFEFVCENFQFPKCATRGNNCHENRCLS